MFKKTRITITALTIFLCIPTAYLLLRFFLYGRASGKIMFYHGTTIQGSYSYIYLTNAFGVPLTRLSGQSGWDTDPAWSPDGSRIAYQCHRDDNRNICIMNADGSGKMEISDTATRDWHPAWSPDGRSVAFDSNGGIYVVEVETKSTLLLIDAEASDPLWSYDGKRILFEKWLDNSPDIFIVNSDGSAPINLTQNPAMDHSAVWSKDDRYIFFVSDRTGNYEIYRMNNDGSNLINLTNNPESDKDPTISPDGQIVAYCSAGDIMIMDLDGEGKQKLTHGKGYDCEPSWSPDGMYIAYKSRYSAYNIYDLYVVRTDGKWPMRLTFLSGVEGISWQP